MSTSLNQDTAATSDLGFADFSVLIWRDAAEKDTAIPDAELKRKITGGMILGNAWFPQLHRAPVTVGVFRFRFHVAPHVASAESADSRINSVPGM